MPHSRKLAAARAETPPTPARARRLLTRSTVATTGGALLILALAACAPEGTTEPDEIEPVEISAGPTAAMTAEDDAVAKSSGEADLIGVLPGGFPENLPLPRPASVVDFGTENDRFVVLRTRLSKSEAQSQMSRRLDGSGWSNAPDPWTRTKGQDRVEIGFETGEAGETLVRIRYGPS